MTSQPSPIVPVRRHQDFALVYDLPDPRSYYRALRPLDYRMPAVACGYLQQHASRIAAARGKTKLRLLDFACGYAPNGALLRCRLTLEQLYGFYEGDAEGDLIAHDGAFFAQHRRGDPIPEVGGLDVAAVALDYARRCGLLNAAFAEDLLATAPSAALLAFLQDTDVVVETGGLGPLLAPCFARMVDSLAGARRPWFLYSPRGTLDEAPVLSMFRERGYRLETCSRTPFRYRRLIDAEEEAEMTAAARDCGNDPAAHFRDGYFINPLRLARPEADAAALAVSAIML